MTTVNNSKPFTVIMTGVSASALLSVASFSGLFQNSTKATGSSAKVFGFAFAALAALGVVGLLMLPDAKQGAAQIR